MLLGISSGKERDQGQQPPPITYVSCPPGRRFKAGSRVPVQVCRTHSEDPEHECYGCNIWKMFCRGVRLVPPPKQGVRLIPPKPVGVRLVPPSGGDANVS